MPRGRDDERAERKSTGDGAHSSSARDRSHLTHDHSTEKLTSSHLSEAAAVKVPAHILFRKDHSLIVWKPRGILDVPTVKDIVRFIETAERNCKTHFNRFSDLSALDAVDLNFKFIFDVGLNRRLSRRAHPPIKSAFYVTSSATAHYVKLHKLLTDFSPLGVQLFTEPTAAAKWLEVPPDVLVLRE